MALFAGRYELGAVIGTGGMAEVRDAIDTRLDRPVAIKLMRPDVAGQAIVRERFEAEARMAARLSHPNVVSIFDSGEDQGIPFIVMERLSGESLHDRLAAGPMRQADAKAMILDVLSALEVAHAAGVLHRDIKPANILDGGNGIWKVADFGIAKALEGPSGAGAADPTVAGVVLGTPAYLAPERLFGAPATVESDLYSIAVVGYEALAGRRPYDASTVEGWAGAAAVAPVVPLLDVRPGVDPVLAAAIERGLAKEPSARYGSAVEMAAAVAGTSPATQLLTGAPATQVMAAAAADSTSVLPAAARPRPVVAPPPEERSRAAMILASLAAIAVIAAILIAIIAANHNNSGSPSTTVTTVANTSTSASSSSTSTTVAPTTTTTVAPTTTTVAPTTTTTVAPTTTTVAPTTTTATTVSTTSVSVTTASG